MTLTVAMATGPLIFPIFNRKFFLEVGSEMHAFWVAFFCGCNEKLWMNRKSIKNSYWVRNVCGTVATVCHAYGVCSWSYHPPPPPPLHSPRACENASGSTSLNTTGPVVQSVISANRGLNLTLCFGLCISVWYSSRTSMIQARFLKFFSKFINKLLGDTFWISG
jgi:hypothetical protein